MDIVNGSSVYADYSHTNNNLCAIYADYLKTNPPVKGIGAATALVAPGGKGAWGSPWGKGKGKGGGKGKSEPQGTFYCFRCWQKDDHLSYLPYIYI